MVTDLNDYKNIIRRKSRHKTLETNSDVRLVCSPDVDGAGPR